MHGRDAAEQALHPSSALCLLSFFSASSAFSLAASRGDKSDGTVSVRMTRPNPTSPVSVGHALSDAKDAANPVLVVATVTANAEQSPTSAVSAVANAKALL